MSFLHTNASSARAAASTADAHLRRERPPRKSTCTSSMCSRSCSLKKSCRTPSTVVTTLKRSLSPLRYAIISRVTYMASSISISRAFSTWYFVYSRS